MLVDICRPPAKQLTDSALVESALVDICKTPPLWLAELALVDSIVYTGIDLQSTCGGAPVDPHMVKKF